MSGSTQHDEAGRKKINLKMLLELQSSPSMPSVFFKAARNGRGGCGGVTWQG